MDAQGPGSPRRPARARGQSLLELVCVLALLGFAVASAQPAVDRYLKRARLRAASRDLGMLIRAARFEAIWGQRNLGIVFDRGQDYVYSLYEDGNGNGIRTADIRRGIDIYLRGPYSISETYPGVTVVIGVPGRIPAIPPDRGPIGNPTDPVQFGPSDIISCSPDGSCSSGTLYLTVGRMRMAAVRVYGPTGRVNFWEFEAGGGAWEQR